MKSLKSCKCRWVRRCWKTLRSRCLLVLQHSEILALPIKSGWNSTFWQIFRVSLVQDAHREQSKIDAVVPQLQFDHGYMGDGGPLQIACFLLGADTSSGAFHATMVPDSKRMDMPMLLRQQSNGCVTWCMHASVYMETKKEFLQLLQLEHI